MSYKLIIAGSRRIDNQLVVRDAIAESPFEIPWGGTIITGGAEGVDGAAARIAQQFMEVKYQEIRPDDSTYSEEQAPLRRNKKMALMGDKLIAVWDGESSGTRHMIDSALDQGLEIYVKVHRPEELTEI